MCPSFRVRFDVQTPDQEDVGDTALGGDTNDLKIDADADHGTVWLYVRDPAQKDAPALRVRPRREGLRAGPEDPVHDPSQADAEPLLQLIKGQPYELWHSHTQLSKLKAAAEAAKKTADEKTEAADEIEQDAEEKKEAADTDAAEAKRLKAAPPPQRRRTRRRRPRKRPPTRRPPARAQGGKEADAARRRSSPRERRRRPPRSRRTPRATWPSRTG